MPKEIRFLVDFRGRLTNEQFYLAGTVTSFDSQVAKRLVDEGRAVYVEAPQDAPEAQGEPTPAEVDTPAPKPKRKRRAPKAKG